MASQAGFAPASNNFGLKHLIWRSAVNTETGTIISIWVGFDAASANWATPPCCKVAGAGFEPALKRQTPSNYFSVSVSVPNV